jgi:hypothetical protein
MGILGDLLTMPALGAPRMVHWLARTLVEQAERGLLDEGRVRGLLLELQEQSDSGELTEEEYGRQEAVLLDQLKAIREVKERRARGA